MTKYDERGIGARIEQVDAQGHEDVEGYCAYQYKATGKKGEEPVFFQPGRQKGPNVVLSRGLL